MWPFSHHTVTFQLQVMVLVEKSYEQNMGEWASRSDGVTKNRRQKSNGEIR